MKRVIIDTNALMVMAEFKVDVLSELERVCDFKYEAYVLPGTIKELEKIREEQRGKFKMAAKLVLAVLQAMKIPILKEEGQVDDLLVKHSQQGDLVLTQDVALKKRLKKPYLTIRQKKKVIIIK